MVKPFSTLDIIQRLGDDQAKHELVNSWPSTKCVACRRHAATGIWLVRYEKQSHPYFRLELKPLCAGCGFNIECLRCDLFLELSAPKGDDRTHADKLIEKLLTHPLGERLIAAWKLMFKPANIHNPIEPAELMLEALVEKYFPPQTNKVD